MWSTPTPVITTPGARYVRRRRRRLSLMFRAPVASLLSHCPRRDLLSLPWAIMPLVAVLTHSQRLSFSWWCMAKQDHRSEEAAAYRKLYKTARWQRTRQAQLMLHPLCQWCLEEEIVTEATEVHHDGPHRGDMDKFWGGPFVSTCKPCHASRGQLEDHGKTVVRYGPDGWPL